MNTKIYSVFDLKIAQFQPLFSFRTDVEAQRHFYRLLMTVPTMTEFPQDYDLRRVGSFDDESGVIISSENSELITNGLSLLELTRQSESNNGQIQEDQTPQERDDASIQQSTESTDTTQ